MYETGRRAHQAQALCRQRFGWYSHVPDSKEDFQQSLALNELPDDSCALPWYQIQSFHGFQQPSVVLVEKIVTREDVVLAKRRSHGKRHRSTTRKNRFKTGDQELVCGNKGAGNKRFPTVGHETQLEQHQGCIKKCNEGPNKMKHLTISRPTVENNAKVGEKLTTGDDDEDMNKNKHIKTTYENKNKCEVKELGSVTKTDGDPKGKTTADGKNIHNHSSWNRVRTKDHSTKGGQRVGKAESGLERNDTGGARTIDQGLQHDGLGPVPPVAASLAVTRRLELGVEGFFAFLFSDRWKEGCVLRVLRGQLLDSLLHVLCQMERLQDIVCCNTMGYIVLHRPLMPCLKTPASTGAVEVIEEKIQVDVDCFYPQEQPQAVMEQKRMSYLPLVSLSNAEDANQYLETPGVRCNMRGCQKPPPHTACLGPYHMVCEPFMKQRHRRESAFPQLTLPKLPGADNPEGISGSSRSIPKSKKSAGTQSLDSTFLGPKLNDKTELVANDVHLVPIFELSTGSFSMSSNRAKSKMIRPAEENRPAEKNKKKSSKKNASDEDLDEEPEFKSWIDTERVKTLQKDLEEMSLELVGQKRILRKDVSQVQGMLERKLRKMKKSKTSIFTDSDVKEQATKHVTLEQAPVEKDTKYLEKKLTVSYWLKIWPKPPTFAEFYYYLKKEQRKIPGKESPKSVKGKKSPQREMFERSDSSNDKTDSKSSKESAGTKCSEFKKKISQSRESSVGRSSSVESSVDISSIDTDMSKTSQKSNSPKQKSVKKKTGTPEKEPSSQVSLEQSKTPSVIDDAPYVYIDDAEIPNNITPKELLDLMQVDRSFNPKKLCSSYSFENLFEHRANQMPNYKKLLSTFSKPFPRKKKPRTPPDKPASKKYVKSFKASLKSSSERRSSMESNPSSPSEPSPPPIILGKLKDFAFLQYKNYVSQPVSSTLPSSAMTPSQIAELLTLAMQKFVVRKERATTYNVYQCSGRVSLTFRKPGPHHYWVGVPPMTDNQGHSMDPEMDTVDV